tara:strand:+ start:71 stop:496 length:426 start_codon:yes stop_codon:yes gene_type:complete
LKVTKQQLKQIIKEEISKILSENELADDVKQDISKKLESLLVSFYGQPHEEGLGLVSYLRKGGKDEGHLKDASRISSGLANELRQALEPYRQDRNMVQAYRAAEGLIEDMADFRPVDSFLDQKVGYIMTALRDGGIKVRTR